MWDPKYITELERRRKIAVSGGGEARIEKQHAKGKLTARERIEILLDASTFVEVGGFIESRIDDFGADKKRVPGDGVVTGYGKVAGRLVFVSSEDFTVHGGTMGEYHLRKIANIQDMAYDARAPFIMINDSGGARIEEGISSLAELGGVFFRNTRASGVIPQIAIVMGPCAGGACYAPAICDFVFMVRESSLMFITGPQVVKTVTHEEVDAQTLGGADMHAATSGVAHFACNSDEECIASVKKLLSYLPDNNASAPMHVAGKPSEGCAKIQDLVPDSSRKSYDVRAVIKAISDENTFMEIQADFARNAVIGLSRIDGDVVGFVANQPDFKSGALDCDTSDKMARFIRFCDCFNIPLVTLVDVPAFLPGREQEQRGIIRHGAKLLFAYSEATVPKIGLVMRKAYGGAYIAMNSKEMGADIVYAWPLAEIAVMGAGGATNIIFHKDIDNAEDPVAKKNELTKAYEDRFMNPYIASARGYVDEVITPEETRIKISAALAMLKNKLRKPVGDRHANIPL